MSEGDKSDHSSVLSSNRYKVLNRIAPDRLQRKKERKDREKKRGEQRKTGEQGKERDRKENIRMKEAKKKLGKMS